jgi:purine-binding chemotaxis protein CheW
VGAINLRGKVVTVIDLRLKLGMPNVKSRQTTVIICDLSPLTIGIVVDSVECVLSVPVSAIQPSSRVQGDPARNFFTGVYEVDGSLFLLIDPARAVNVHSYLESLAGAG